MNLFGQGSSDRDDFRSGEPPRPHDRPEGRFQGVSTARITIWIVVGAIGLYMIVSGVIGGINAGA